MTNIYNVFKRTLVVETFVVKAESQADALAQFRVGKAQKVAQVENGYSDSDVEVKFLRQSRRRIYHVYYRREPDFQEVEQLADMGELLSKYQKVMEVIAENPEEVYAKMQGEHWSKNGSANDYIRLLGLKHTSMSVGDIVTDDDGEVYSVGDVGFIKVKIYE